MHRAIRAIQKARRTARAVVITAAVGACTVGAGGCGTDAHGVSACRTIEQARCRRASLACPTLLSSDETDLQACLEAARDRCLHGMALSSEPASVLVDACARAIGQASCEALQSPETIAECASLLIPPEQPPTGATGPGVPDAGPVDDSSAPSSADSGT